MQNYSPERWRWLSPSFCFMHEKLFVTQWSPCQLCRYSFPTEQYYCKQQLCSEPLNFKTFPGRSPLTQRPFPTGKPKLHWVRDPFDVWQETEHLLSWGLQLQTDACSTYTCRRMSENYPLSGNHLKCFFFFWEFLETLLPSSFSPQWLLEKAAGYWTWTEASWVAKIPF